MRTLERREARSRFKARAAALLRQWRRVAVVRASLARQGAARRALRTLRSHAALRRTDRIGRVWLGLWRWSRALHRAALHRQLAASVRAWRVRTASRRRRLAREATLRDAAAFTDGRSAAQVYSG